MATTKITLTSKLNKLFQQGQWEDARRLLEKEHAKNPNDHWVLTQLGVTFYEQRRYKDALKRFLASRQIVPDCPLTLWNLAGTLGAVGQQAEAIQIYTWLLNCTATPADDPCWESKAWADALKSDCVYRLGACFQRLHKNQDAENCYRQYLNLLLSGVRGSYSVDDVFQRIRTVHGDAKDGNTQSELRKAFRAAAQSSGTPIKSGRKAVSVALNLGCEFIGGTTAAVK